MQAAPAAIRRETEAHLRRRIDRAAADGEPPAGTDAEALAGHVMAVVQGLSTLARDGAARAKLRTVAETAMPAWPASRQPDAAGTRDHGPTAILRQQPT
ncbi:hypothetical protein [uncultured Methylobacterium sp.]|uniref:hypothetical protein n=1 Tax=uncultured Methylobacterium sp. TaxID=157278 RepID=UPI0035CC47BD